MPSSMSSMPSRKAATPLPPCTLGSSPPGAAANSTSVPGLPGPSYSLPPVLHLFANNQSHCQLGFSHQRPDHDHDIVDCAAECLLVWLKIAPWLRWTSTCGGRSSHRLLLPGTVRQRCKLFLTY